MQWLLENPFGQTKPCRRARSLSVYLLNWQTEIGDTNIVHKEEEKCIRNIRWRSSSNEKSLRRPRRKWEDNVKTDCKKYFESEELWGIFWPAERYNFFKDSSPFIYLSGLLNHLNFKCWKQNNGRIKYKFRILFNSGNSQTSVLC